jgi:hypothetical protein
VTPGPEGQVVSFAPAPPAPQVPVTGEEPHPSTEDGDLIVAPPSTPEPVLTVTSGDQVLFRWWGATSPWTASPYMLEDFPNPEVQLRAVSFGEWWFFPTGAAHSYMTFRQEWRTAHVPLPAANLRPVSRGAPCEPSPPGPCPWTDGKLEPVQVRQGPIGPNWLKLTLPEPTRLRHAVVRGMTGASGTWFVLEGSVDGEQWVRLALAPLKVPEDIRGMYGFWRNHADRTQWDSPFDGEFAVMAPSFGESPLEDVGPVRYVRLSETSFFNGSNGVPRSISRVAEVSLFE